MEIRQYMVAHTAGLQPDDFIMLKVSYTGS